MKLKTKHYIGFLLVISVLFFSKLIFGISSLWEDMIYQEYPNRIFSRDALLNFTFPHWNPFTFGGMPFFAAMQSGFLYPLNILQSLIPSSKGHFWYIIELFVVVHFFIAGVTMFLFVREKNLSRKASFFAAISYMLTGFFMAHIIHSMMLNILVWLPLVALLLDKSIKQNSFKYSILAGLTLGLSNLAGHPQVTFYEFIFLGCYSLLMIFENNKPFKSIIFPFVMFSISIGIVSIMILPALELSKESVREAWSFQMTCEGTMSFGQFITFLIPKFFGAYTGDNSVPAYWLNNGVRMGIWSFWDTTFYVGFSIFILAIAQFLDIKKNKFNMFVFVWTIVVISIALGQHFFVYKLFFKFIPGFNKFRSPARILFTLSFLFPILAASTFDQLFSQRKSDKKNFIYILLAGSAFLGMLTVSGFMKNIWPQLEDSELAAFTIKQGWILILNVFLTAFPLILFFTQKISSKLVETLVILALIVDMFIFGFGMHQIKTMTAPRYYSQGRELISAIQKEQKRERFRVSMRQFVLSDTLIHRQSRMILRRNQGMIDKIELLEGYNPLELAKRYPPVTGSNFQEFLDLMNVKYYINPNFNGSNDLILLNESRLPRAKMFFNFKIFNSNKEVHSFMASKIFEYKKMLLLSEKPSIEPTEGVVENCVDIKKYKNNRIVFDVTTQKNGILWTSEVWYPAWKVFIDGKEAKLLQADYAFRAVEVPEGKHRVEFRYSSAYFKVGFIVSLLTILISLFSLFVAISTYNKRVSSRTS